MTVRAAQHVGTAPRSYESNSISLTHEKVIETSSVLRRCATNFDRALQAGRITPSRCASGSDDAALTQFVEFGPVDAHLCQ